MRRADADDYETLADMLARARSDEREPDPAFVARRRRRRLVGLGATLLVVLLIAASVFTYVRLSLTAPLPAATVSIVEPVVAPAPPVTLSLPQVGASAVSVMGADDFAGTSGTNGILASSGTADPLPIASISKLITAMVILDARPIAPTEPGPTITFTKADSDLYDDYYVRGATIQPMKTGSSMVERDALEMMLVVSASNYAEVVSTWAFGSQANFLRATTAWLAAKGLTGTTILEPTGLDSRNRSTTADLIALGKLAIADPVIAEIVRSPALDVPGFDPVSNNNDLLGVNGITGIKTGTLEAAGSCLLFSADVSVGSSRPITVVGVVLGGAARGSVDTAVSALITSITTGFHDVPVVTKGHEFGTYTTEWGEEARIVAARDASVFTWSDAPVSSTMTQPKTLSTAKLGTQVGRITYSAESDDTSVMLALDRTISPPDDWWRLTHPGVLLGR